MRCGLNWLRTQGPVLCREFGHALRPNPRRSHAVKSTESYRSHTGLEPRELFDTVRNEEFSMCGYGAAVAMLTAVRHMGATLAELVRYATSGEINGDLQEVVGYAGVIVPAGSKSPTRQSQRYGDGA